MVVRNNNNKKINKHLMNDINDGSHEMVVNNTKGNLKKSPSTIIPSSHKSNNATNNDKYDDDNKKELLIKNNEQRRKIRFSNDIKIYDTSLSSSMSSIDEISLIDKKQIWYTVEELDMILMECIEISNIIHNNNNNNIVDGNNNNNNNGTQYYEQRGLEYISSTTKGLCFSSSSFKTVQTILNEQEKQRRTTTRSDHIKYYNSFDFAMISSSLSKHRVRIATLIAINDARSIGQMVSPKNVKPTTTTTTKQRSSSSCSLSNTSNGSSSSCSMFTMEGRRRRRQRKTSNMLNWFRNNKTTPTSSCTTMERQSWSSAMKNTMMQQHNNNSNHFLRMETPTKSLSLSDITMEQKNSGLVDYPIL